MEITEKQPHSRQYLNKRKLLVVIPLVTLPFITTILWIFGFGGGQQEVQTPVVKGINTNVPGAENTPDNAMDKMAFYQLAEKDSADKASIDKRDPYLAIDKYGNHYGIDSMGEDFQKNESLQPGSGPGSGYESNETKIRQKLALLNSSLNTATSPEQVTQPVSSTTGGTPVGVNNADVDRLESMMKMQNSGTGEDPEMQQLGQMLGQIVDIQHPDLVRQRQQAASAKARGQVFAISTSLRKGMVSSLDSPDAKNESSSTVNGFYALDMKQAPVDAQNTIEAIVYETQTLVTGSYVKLRLMNDVFINGQLVPKNTFIYGTASINGERLDIDIQTLRSNKAIYPVRLAVYDLDGQSGIYIPGAISRNVSKESADQTLQGLSLSSMDPSISGQAMGAGIDAAKSLLSKKVKLVRVTVKAGYQLLLRDQKQKDEN